MPANAAAMSVAPINKLIAHAVVVLAAPSSFGAASQSLDEPHHTPLIVVVVYRRRGVNGHRQTCDFRRRSRRTLCCFSQASRLQMPLIRSKAADTHEAKLQCLKISVTLLQHAKLKIYLI